MLEKINNDSTSTKPIVPLTKWGIKYKKSKFDLTGVVSGHKELPDGSEIGHTSGIVNAAVDYDDRIILFETRNTVYSCNFGEYVNYIIDYEDKWKKGAASPKVFDDVIDLLLDKESLLHVAVMGGMISTIVDGIKNQMDDDKDIVINVDEAIQQDYENRNSMAKETLYKHIGSDIKITGAWDNVFNKRQLNEDELLPSEILAVTFEIGGYSVRDAERVYIKQKDGSEIPADKDTVEIAKKLKKNNLSFGIGNEREKNIRIKNEISAKRIKDESGAFSDGYKIICQASQSLKWYEQIDFICTILVPPFFSPSNEILFVNITYVGDSFSSENWYSLNPSGIIKSYRIHPYDSDSFKAVWNVADTKDGGANDV